MYSAQLLDHFQNPRNPGELADADADAKVENPACGDVMLLSLKLSGGRIAQARFKCKGCVAAIACASALTELILGKSPEEAKRVRREDLSAEVGGLPQASSHAAQLSLDTLALALSRLPSFPPP
jgi:nitrogen fixation NifU-like protein